MERTAGSHPLAGAAHRDVRQHYQAPRVTSSIHTLNSSYREILIEHLFIGEIMRRLWLKGITQFEVLQPQVDDSGYDLVIEANGVVRHIQLKSSFDAAATGQVKASLKLALKWDSPARADTLTLRDASFFYSILLEVSRTPVAKR